ncbi:glycosyltransferase family 25 protein [Photobacterium swingsii]|uniref:glycosyltransferase family 25 protein n=1 Tax=Photobacterium swingsii TaxID=680026 RepID=UPI00406932EF
MLSTPKIFIISLARSKERRIHVKKQMAKLGLDFDFIDAVDGKVLDTSTRKFDHQYCIEKYNHSLSNGEYACANSHIIAYEKIIKDGLPEAVILEDDFILDDKFAEILDAIQRKAPNKMELAYLFHGKAKSWPMKRHLVDNFKLAKYISPSKKSKRTIISTVGYIITNTGAAKLLDIAYPIRMPSDYLLGRLQDHHLKTYGVEPSCIYLSGFESDIDNVTKRNYGAHINK